MPFDWDEMWGGPEIRRAEDQLIRAMNNHQDIQAQQAALAQRAAIGQGQANPPNEWARNPWGEPPPIRGGDLVGILDEFNTAFQHGIREVIVDQRVYFELVRFINLTYNTPLGAIGNHLQIATAGGRLTVRPDGPKMPTAEDFDRYMECVECDKLP